MYIYLMVKIIQKNNPLLRQVAKPLKLDDIASAKTQKTINSIKEALEKIPDGVGLCAPQIGISLRIFIVSHRAFEVDMDEDGVLVKKEVITKQKDMVFINPKIIRISKKRHWITEGCMSVEYFYGNTYRADKVTISGYDECGNKFTHGASGLIAQIFQHEIDHLNGVLFIDHAKQIKEIHPDELKKRNGKNK